MEGGGFEVDATSSGFVKSPSLLMIASKSLLLSGCGRGGCGVGEGEMGVCSPKGGRRRRRKGRGDWTRRRRE